MKEDLGGSEEGQKVFEDNIAWENMTLEQRKEYIESLRKQDLKVKFADKPDPNTKNMTPEQEGVYYTIKIVNLDSDKHKKAVRFVVGLVSCLFGGAFKLLTNIDDVTTNLTTSLLYTTAVAYTTYCGISGVIDWVKLVDVQERLENLNNNNERSVKQ